MTNGQATMSVQPNVGGMLCYTPCCIGLIFSIVVAIVEKKSRYMRFHAFQSLLVHGVAFVIAIGVQIASVIAHMVAGPLGLIISMLGIPVGLGLLGLTIFLMVKAYGNEEYKLPTLGDMAQQWV